MMRIPLLECSESLHGKSESQGLKVEAGVVSFCIRVKTLPSPGYQKDTFFYDPKSLPKDRTAIDSPEPDWLQNHLMDVGSEGLR
jgi:hypothetical protein